MPAGIDPNVRKASFPCFRAKVPNLLKAAAIRMWMWLFKSAEGNLLVFLPSMRQNGVARYVAVILFELERLCIEEPHLAGPI